MLQNKSNMKLLYAAEHLSCFQYDKSNTPIIERIERLKEEKFNIHNEQDKLLFILKGSISVSYDKHVNEKLNLGDFFFVPSGVHYNSTAIESSTILIFRMKTSLNFCDHFSFEMLLANNSDNTNNSNDFITLKANTALENYMETIDKFILEGLKCSYLFELKLKELLFILRAYYSKEDLKKLFSSILTDDLQFSNKIYENCDKVKSSRELAKLMNYSPSGFEKRFKRIFGTPAYQWMKTRKAKNIYHEINCTKKTFSEIGFEYGFSSSSYFNDFCKANFGKTPGEIRKQKQIMHKQL